MVPWGVCAVAGGHVWLPGGVCGCRGACVVAGGTCMVAGGSCMVTGVCVVVREACMVAGGMCGCSMWGWGMHGCWGACVVAGGVHGCWGVCVVEGACMVAGGCVHRIRRDTVNERAVRILLECILVNFITGYIASSLDVSPTVKPGVFKLFLRLKVHSYRKKVELKAKIVFDV